MPTNRKRSTRRSPEQFIAAAESFAAEVHATLAEFRARAAALRDEHGRRIKGFGAMMGERAPWTREFSAWLMLDSVAEEGFDSASQIKVDSEAELAELAQRIAAAEDASRKEKRRMRICTWIAREANKLWSEVSREVAREAKKGRSMLEGDFDPWGSRERALATLVSRRTRRRDDLVRLRELFLAESSRVLPSTRNHPIEARKKLAEAQDRIAVALFYDRAAARDAARSQGRRAA